ncbi:MAG: YdcF family protein [Acidobacteriota bacterium]|nr:YdcF family protein [Acidobacteriota bacterium]
MAARRRILPVTIISLVILATLYVSCGVWLPAVGRLLIHDDGPAPADIAVLLAGEYDGYRARFAAGLVRAGYVPMVMVSGPPGMYDTNEADAAIRYLTARGYPESIFIPVRHVAKSTREEARIILAELARRHIRSFLLVTSNYHTARSRRIFLAAERAQGGGPGFRTVAAADPIYDPARWWRYRDGCKTAFYEWSKTFATFAGF